MINQRDAQILFEAYQSIILNESVDEERKKSMEIIGRILRHLNLTHDDQWPDDLFIELRDSLNRIKFQKNHPGAADVSN